MMLEIIQASGARTWHRLERLPLTLGRGLANDLILDDPYVDASHARLARDDAGKLVLEDLGSINGLVVGVSRLRGLVEMRPGGEVTLGRTKLRFHDPNEPVAAAVVDEPAATSPLPEPAAHIPIPPLHATQPQGHPRWAANTRNALLLAVAAVIAFAVNVWSASVEQSTASVVFSTGLGFLLVAVVWAGIWAGASRVAVQRFHFTGHLAVGSAIALIAIVIAMIQEWVTFLFPDSTTVTALAGAAYLGLLAALVAWHLSLASALVPRRRWQIGLLVAAAVLVVTSVSSLTEEDSFSDVAVFSGVLKPVPPKMVPTATINDFSRVALQIKLQVDETVRK